MKQVMTFEKAEQSFSAPIQIRDPFTFDENSAAPEMFADLNLEKGKYFWGYANIATPDSQGDKFTLDALTQISQTLTVAPYNKILINHNFDDIAVGTIVATRMDSLGLLILGKLNESHQRAEEVWGSILNKSLDGFSLSGNFIKVIAEFDEKTGEYINLVMEATASEVTLTSLPVHPGASVMGTFRKSMQKSNERFLKSFKNGKEIKAIKSDKYKKASDNDNSMTDDANVKNEDENKSQNDSSDSNAGADSNDSKDDVKNDKKDDSKKDDSSDVNAAADDAAKEVSEGKVDDDGSDKADKSDDDKKEDSKKSTVDERLVEADKKISELTDANSKLSEENAELKTKLGNYEKAVKTGFKKAMNDQANKTGIPFRKSKKVLDEKTDSSGDSNSTPMLNWLVKKN